VRCCFKECFIRRSDLRHLFEMHRIQIRDLHIKRQITLPEETDLEFYTDVSEVCTMLPARGNIPSR
jgi:hypothetical protein